MSTLNADELAFYTKHTGIQDQDKLKDHITEVAKKAFEIFPILTIITSFMVMPRFCNQVRSQSGYKRLLELGSTRKNALFLDLDVAVIGNDIRKAIADGFPAENIIASDIHAGACSNSQNCIPVIFIPGDAFDPSFISIQPPLKTLPTAEVESISLRSLLQAEPKSINPLRGHLSAIHTSAFFHLFNKDEQVIIAKKLASLLSPLPGSIIFGSQIGSEVPHEAVKPSRGTLLYSHSPESRKMWEEEVSGMEDQGEESSRMIQVDAGLWDERHIWWVVTRL
ncbi:hypothetical protein BT96DRAFT_913990 [Gymnopus androsaceus JB14]|uniref:Uncharacterized protein n=1 Tax=Gymnopus androsaceus JB14 TaxID=1447944 RepID=A0A6A4IEL4_9AGAR|nr:hypothetical protein BT96DRAFT_913990 [Gymnopus androsaceus JB14]